MSAPIDNGGPAFPVIDTSQNTATGETTVYQAVQSGISVRDYFAAKAMQGLIAATGDSDGVVTYDSKTVAASAYEMADAMLKARSQP